MISASRRRPGSSGFVAVLLFLGAAAGAAAADPQVRLAPGAETNDRIARWIREDGRWMRSVPPAARAVGPAAADSLAGGDARAWEAVRRRILAATSGARGDTLTAWRTADALLRQRWLERGHLGATVSLRGDTFLVAPGPVWTVRELLVEGDGFPGRGRLLATWLPRPGDRFAAEDYARGVRMVLRGTGEAGYPYARWVTRSADLDPSAHEVTLRARLLPGNRSWIGPVTSDLAEGRGADFLVRAAGIATGAPFRQSDLERAVQRLLSRDLYDAVQTPVVYLTGDPDTVGVHFPVKARRKTNRIQVVLGLSRAAEDGQGRLSGEVDLDLPNMAGSGRGLRVGWRDDGVSRSRFGFSYLEPLAFGTPLDLGLALDNEVDRDVYTRFRLDSVWRLPVVALWGIELGMGWDRSTFPAGELERTGRTRARGAVSHRRGDRTRSGWEGLFAIETAWRSAHLRADAEEVPTGTGLLAPAATQRIFEADASGEWMLGRTLAVYGRASFRQLTGDDGLVPLSEQFRFGGAASLRGYREQEFHGTTGAWGGLEVRIGRPLGSRLYTFYDLGYFEFEAPDPAGAGEGATLLNRGWPKGYGLGLFVRTPAGDISLAIGFPGTVDFDQAKLHVTLLETF